MRTKTTRAASWPLPLFCLNLIAAFYLVGSLQFSVAQGAAINIPIYCDDNPVGNIVVDTAIAQNGRRGVRGGFVSTIGDPPSLAAAAEQCHEDHFNWFQVITADNHPPNDAQGHQLVPPYPDPPPGGYGAPDTQWADGLPWYWDEGADPPANTPGFSDGYNLDDNLRDEDPADGTIETLHFEDFPGGANGLSLSFCTWLVSLNADGSLHEFHEGFSWTYIKNEANPNGLSTLGDTKTAEQGLQLYNQVVPEPSSIVLASVGLMLCAAARYRRLLKR